MSKLTEMLREIGVHGQHVFADGNVYLWRWKPGWCVNKMWCAWRPEDETNLAFSDRGRSNGESLAEAKAWAGERYGITEWARTPYGTWMDARFVKERLKELRAQLKAREVLAAALDENDWCPWRWL